MTLELSPSKVGQWADTAALQPDAPGFTLPVTLTPQLSLWRLIARGCSLTYEGFDRRVGARVCVKLAAHARDGAVRERVLSQAALYANVEHPSLAPVLDIASLSDGTPYIVSEFVSGQTLAELMRKSPVGIALACEVTSQLLGALGALHRVGLVVGHLSAELVYIDFAPDGRRRVRLLDSGFGRLDERADAVLYQAPELLVGGTPDARSDLYALGLLLHEMLTGVCPHAELAASDLTAARLRDDIGDAALLRAGVSSALSRVVVGALARDPEARFASVDEMLCELLAARADDSCLWRLPSGPEVARAGVQEVSSVAVPLPSVAPAQAPLDSAVWKPDLSQTLDLAPPRSKGWKALLVGFGVTFSAGAALLLPLESTPKSAESELREPAATVESSSFRSTQGVLKAEPSAARTDQVPNTQAAPAAAGAPADAPVAPTSRAGSPAPLEARDDSKTALNVREVPPARRHDASRSTSLPAQRPEAEHVRSSRAKSEPASNPNRSGRSRARRSSEPADLPANPY